MIILLKKECLIVAVKKKKKNCPDLNKDSSHRFYLSIFL